MKNFMRFLLVSAGLLFFCGSALCQNNVTVTLYNGTTNTMGSWGVAGNVYQSTGSPLEVVNQTPTSWTYVSGSLGAPGSSAIYTCLNSTIADFSGETLTWNAEEYYVQYALGTVWYSTSAVGKQAGNHWQVSGGATNLVKDYYSITINIGGAYVPPPPTSTNVTQCIQNTSGHFVNATANVGGNLIGSSTLYPGQTWCVTARLQMDGSSGSFDMGYTLSPLENLNGDPNNPFATNGMNSDFSVTNGFSNTNFTPINPFSGDTNFSQGGGGSYTNNISVGSTNFSNVLWTNNINYPNSGTAGDARDSTIKAGFGTLHNDNAVALSALKLVWTDLEGIKYLASVETNLLGQVITAIFHATNSDQIPVYINSVTNNANANQVASTMSITNAIGREQAALTNAIAQGGNSSQMTNVNNTLGGISNLFSQITDMTNADIGTETTQAGISNLLSSMGRNLTNGSMTISNNWQSPTNRATESTLSAIFEWLKAGLTNRLVAPSNYDNIFPASATNGAAARAATVSIFATPLAYFDDVISSLSTSPDVGGDPGHSSMWEMDFCGRTIDLDPVDMFPSLPAFSIGIWDFVLVSIYLSRIGWMYIKVVQIYATAQTGGVPNMDIFGGISGFKVGVEGGGNWKGIAVAIIMPAVFLATWLVVVTLMIVPLGEFIGLYQAISTVFSAASGTSAGAIGLHILFAFFPVVLAIRLLTAWLVIQFTMAQAMIVASGISRHLFGK